jgi:streptogramin lyase
VQTGKEANECREKLGLPAVHDPREFEVGGSAVKMGLSSAFAADVDGLWLGSGQRLFHLDWNLKTSFSVSLPKDASTPIHALCLSSSNIWIATGGDGLIEFDKENHRCRRFTVEDGLLMNAISCLSLAENQLWIGYGHKGQLGPGQMGIAPGGGVGYLDFVSNHFMSFQPSLAEGGEAQEVLSGNRVKESPANPTRRVVWAIAAGASGVVWFLDEQTAVRRFQSRQNLWEATPMVGRCLVIRGAKLFVGQTSREPRDPHSDPGPLGVRILDSQTGQWASLDCDEGLPAEQVSAIAVDGEDLWVGGLGYIALVDAKQNQIRKFAYIPANVVDQIQIGGGCVWAQYNGCLRRVSLAGAP